MALGAMIFGCSEAKFSGAVPAEAMYGPNNQQLPEEWQQTEDWLNPDDPLGSVPPYLRTRQVVTQDEQSNAELFVPLNVYYEGQFSGSDAQFTFYVARVSPFRDTREKEMIKSVRKNFIQQSLPKFCKCGQKNDMMFLWKHIKGRMGALHTRFEGEWLVSHHVSSSSWMSKGLKTVPQGKHTVFLGADTENPNFLFDSQGNGYLRTATYAPNSNIFGAFFGFPDKKKWEHRDDMRLALSCDVTQCPDGLGDSTSLELLHHPSMVP